MRFIKYLVCFIVVSALFTVICNAVETTDKYDKTIKQLFQLYLLMYWDCAIDPYVSDTDISVDVTTADFHNCKAWELEKSISSPEKFNDSASSYLDSKLSDQAYRETLYLRLIDGRLVLLELGPQYVGYDFNEESETYIVSETATTITLKHSFWRINSQDRESIDYTFIVNKITNKICGGTFVEELLEMNVGNAYTSDSAVYITAAAGVIALCCAVICKKKIKE